MNPEIATFEALAKEILRRCMADDDPEEMRSWLSMAISRMGIGDNDSMLTWEDSFFFVDEMINEYERRANIPEADRKLLDWPWPSWNEKVDPIEEGMLGLITAPDGQGKTIYAENIAEHWAKRKNKIVFVHYELNWKLMMLRRTARHTSLTVRMMKEGKLTKAEKDLIVTAKNRMKQWEGNISYLHTPGWTMEKTTAELARLNSEGLCDAVVLDYLEKVASSNRQLKMFGSQHYMREADNVEQLKNFSEQKDVPVIMVAQMSKSGKKTSSHEMDRTDIRGAGEKSDKANLVIILKRDRVDEGYSNTVNGIIDKNTMGATGSFSQIMQPEFYRVGDPAIGGITK